ncbi:MAG: ATP-binding protein [Myxococcales bacterium]
MRWPHLVMCALLCLTPALPRGARADEPTAQRKQVSAAERWTARAAQIRALEAGELEPDVEAQALFSLPLDDPSLVVEGEHLAVRMRRALDALATVESLPRRKRKSARAAIVQELGAEGGAERARSVSAAEAAVRDLEQAMLAYFALPAEQRTLRLREHAHRRQEQSRRARQLEQVRARVQQVQQEVDQLTAFFAGELEPAVEPRALLHLDLAPTPARPTGDEGGSAPEPGSELETLTLRLRRLRSQRESLRLRFARLPAEEREALLAHHEAIKAAAADRALAAARAREAAVDDAERAAEEAERDRKAALEAAERAQTEAQRLIARERARLLSVKAALSDHEARLTRASREVADHHERALQWSSRARDLQTRLPGAGNAQAEALSEFLGVGDALTSARASVRMAREAIASDSDVPSVGPDLDPGVRERIDTSAVDTLRTELQTQRAQLVAAERAHAYARLDGLMQDMALMNQARLVFLSRMAPRHRDRYTSFGPDGVRQVQAEADMIVLQAQHRLGSWPRLWEAVRDDLSTSPVPLLLRVVQLLFVLWAFLWWRKRADRILSALQRPSEGNGLSARTRVVLWYVRRIRKPLEWLALFAVVTQLLSFDELRSELEVVRTILLWTMTGWVVINLIDAIAVRHQLSWTSQSDTSRLRIRTLRVVGIAVVGAGLVLSLSESSVGRGAIDAWIRTVCALIALPLLLLIVHWWRGIIFRRLSRLRQPDATVRWVLSRREGIASYPAATVGGAYLLMRGTVRMVSNWASELESVRRLMAHIFRSEVARQADERGPEGDQPLDEETRKALREATPDDDLIESAGREAMEQAAMAARSGRAFCAVVGERGIGKSTVLRRIAERLNEDAERDARVVRCPMGGFSALLRRLAETLELPDGLAEDDLVERLGESLERPLVICLDDAQRLIRPTIGGLSELDQLARFARNLGDRVSWVVAVEAPSFRFVERARGQRLLFDRVIRLQPWSESEIAELVGRATRRWDLTADYSALVVPSRFDDPDESNEARAERGFNRILWDYAGGNPSVALYFWADSLVMRNGRLHVRLFPIPELSDLEELPSGVHFVLRTILQLELASERSIIECTNMAQSEVADALRFIQARGYVESVQRHVRIARRWYRAITIVLRRQHLLAS